MDSPSRKKVAQLGQRNVKVKEVQFCTLSSSEIARYGEIEVCNWNLYDQNRQVAEHGALDKRLGPSEHHRPCGTCGETVTNCHGHFGHVKLNLPVFHTGYMKHLYAIAQSMCKTCGRVLLPEEKREGYLRRLRRKDLDQLKRRAIVRKITEDCKKIRECPFCEAFNGTIKKSPGIPLAFRHERYVKDSMHASGQNSNAVILADTLDDAKKANPALTETLENSKITPGEDLNPLVMLHLTKNLSLRDKQLLGMLDPGRLFIETVPVPPGPIRPTVSAGAGINEDDITVQINQIMKYNNDLGVYLETGSNSKAIVELWRCLQDEVNRMINSEASGLGQPVGNSSRTIRSICSRLKGKEGRFRGNLSGKRVDFSGRTVISPDPNVGVDEVVVPLWVAKRLTFCEVVCAANIERLRACVRRGQEEHPGAALIRKKSGITKMCFGLKQNRRINAEQLEYGDMVERHMADGDIVLFNRQPSLHRCSIMAHKARVMPGRTFRFNECVCTPYNADFDGDEMNLHFPQGQEARAEAANLMAMKNSIISAKNGEPIIAATQDFLTAGFLLTQKNCFFTRGLFCQIICHFTSAREKIELPCPTVLKPVELWTGKQIFSMMIRPNKKAKNVLVSLEVEERNYSRKGKYMCENDGFVVVQNSELMCGNLGKKVLGEGGKNSLYARLIRDCDVDFSVAGMGRLSKLSSRFLQNIGMTIGVDDVAPHPLVMAAKKKQMEISYEVVEKNIQKFRDGTLELKPGCNAHQTLEALISQELGNIRQTVGEACETELPFTNKPRIMSQCGSKGSAMNLCQMMACLGQQQVGGSRIKDGFVNRTLPHFKVGSFEPVARGFVENSFYLGLTPAEFFFHTMGGREGLVDTAVKTAETGYMQRRLTKALEDLSIKYDMTVRTSDSNVVQFTYGEDGLSPAMMETKTRPFDVKKTWVEVRAVTGGPRKKKKAEPRHPSTTILNLDRSAFPESYFMKPLSPDEISTISATTITLVCDKIQKNFSMQCDALGVFKEEISDFMKIFVDKLLPLWPLELSRDEEMLIDDLGLLMTQYQLEEFIDRCGLKLLRAFCEPGDPVGVVAAQSIGEPATQMTLKTFHFAGVASMNVTLGVPRITELINAAKNINTPIIECKLEEERSEISARIVKARIEKTSMGDICKYIKEVHDPGEGMYLVVKVDMVGIRNLQLDLVMEQIKEAIEEQTRPKVARVSDPFGRSRDKLKVFAQSTTAQQQKKMYFDLQMMKTAIPKVVVKGCPRAIRAVVNRDEKSTTPIFNLLVEGYGLQDVMVTPGVRGETTKSNHVMEMKEVLGIEAARSTIMNEICTTMGAHGLHIDGRHVQLLGDCMTVRGEVLGINRFGISQMRTSTLMLASFERTTDHLFDASAYDRIDPVDGVSECIILGAPVQLGTGLLQLVYDQPRSPTSTKRTPLFRSMQPSKRTKKA